MLNISKDERELLKESGCWTIWDTILGQYAHIILIVISIALIIYIIWTEVEEEIFSFVWTLIVT